MTLVEAIKKTAMSTGYFILGFLCGTMIDLIFGLVYNKLDPAKPGYHRRLITFVVLQLFAVVSVLSLIINIRENTTGQKTIYMFMVHIGFISSQFYLFDYLSKYVGEYLMKYPGKFPLRPSREIKIFNDPEQENKQ